MFQKNISSLVFRNDSLLVLKTNFYLTILVKFSTITIELFDCSPNDYMLACKAASTTCVMLLITYLGIYQNTSILFKRNLNILIFSWKMKKDNIQFFSLSPIGIEFMFRTPMVFFYRAENNIGVMYECKGFLNLVNCYNQKCKIYFILPYVRCSNIRLKSNADECHQYFDINIQ